VDQWRVRDCILLILTMAETMHVVNERSFFQPMPCRAMPYHSQHTTDAANATPCKSHRMDAHRVDALQVCHSGCCQTAHLEMLSTASAGMPAALAAAISPSTSAPSTLSAIMPSLRAASIAWVLLALKKASATVPSFLVDSMRASSLLRSRNSLYLCASLQHATQYQHNWAGRICVMGMVQVAVE
jgi:hypothetical protein